MSLASFEDGLAHIDARGEQVVLELGFDEPHNIANTLAAVAAAQAMGITPSGRVAPRFSSLRGELVELEDGVTVVNDCYNANPMSMRAALDHLSGSAPTAARSPYSAAWRSWVPRQGATTRRSASWPTGWASTSSSRWAIWPWATARGFSGESHSVGTPEEAGALLGDISQPGDRVLIKGSRSVGLERVLGPGRWLMGTILIAMMGSLFICMFLGPKFIAFLRAREFGQHIREEGPAGHHAKAGTPTMGGLLIFLAVSVPFLILGHYDAGSMAVFGTALACAALGFVDDWVKITKRRSLGVSPGTSSWRRRPSRIGLWYVATEVVGLEPTLQSRLLGHLDRPRLSSTRS